MKILSLFNGISGLHLACDKAGIDVDVCYYSEIDKFANKVTEHHYPNDIALGDVTKWREWDIDWSSIDLVGAGFPCQAWSVAGQQLGDKDERGMLFWTTLEIIKHVLYFNPKAKFLMENVKMKKDFEQYITHHTEQALGHVEKTLINSALVSAQNRQRYYWTNFEVTQPDDKGILLRDVLEQPPQYAVTGGAIRGRYNEDGTISQRLELNGMEKTNTLTTVQKDNVVALRPCERIKDGNTGHVANATDIKGMDCIKRVYGQDGKAPTLTTMGGGHREPKVIQDDIYYRKLTTVQKDNVVVFKDKSQTLLATIYKENAKSMVKRGKMGLCVSDENSNEYEKEGIHYRKLTPLECERLQTIPGNWTSMLSNTQRYKSIGNGWCIDVIVHILKCMVDNR